jgi:uncharacterized membrane protein HdeD (DUF308 family)
MASQVEKNPALASISNRAVRRRLRGALVLVMGCLAILSPFFAGTLALLLVGLLLIMCGALEMLETFEAPDENRRRSAYLGGALSILAGILLLAQPQLLLRGLTLFVAGSFLIDAIGKIVTAARTMKAGASWKWLLVSGLVNAVLALVLVARWPISGQVVVVILVGIRIVSVGWSMLLGRDARHTLVADPTPSGQHPDHGLGLPPHPDFAVLERSLLEEDAERRWADFAWCWTLVIVFFAIHFGRMQVEWNLVGMMAPLAAVAGDIGTALIIAFCIILPFRLAWRKLTRPLERHGWERLLARAEKGDGDECHEDSQ